MTGDATHWPDVAVNEVCEFKYGKSLPTQKRAGGDVGVFGSNGLVGWHDQSITSGPTIIIGRKGSLGEVNFSERACWPIDTTYYIDAMSTEADLKWLSYRLAGLGLKDLNQAATIPGLSREDAYRQRILLPPLPEQRRIAEVLDRAEALRAKRREALAQLDELTQSIFLDMFGTPGTTPMEPLGARLSFVTSGGRGWARFYTHAGKRFIRSLDVKMNYIDDSDAAYVSPPDNAEARRTAVKTGDVLLTITGSRIGRVATVPERLEDAHISQHVAILRPRQDAIRPEFLSFFLSLETEGQRQIAKAQYGQTKPGLNFQQISKFKVPAVDLPLQDEFTRRFGAVERLEASQRAHLAELDALFASLQQRAFRGEL